ncbi:MAG: PTS sugar transporter subunit IIA [Lentisphaeria bacterium]|nr:PTS sugar transporter subunit IIA [Lentisphaeria bacterium]
MILTLKELAEYLRVNERTIQRMIDRKVISGTKIGGQWRFMGSEIDKIFFGKGAESPKAPAEGQTELELAAKETQANSIITRPQIGIPVSRVMNENRILLNLKSKNKEDVIKELTDSRLLYGLVLDASELRSKCLQRENILSTGVGEGIAIPHPRDPIATLRASAAIIYGYSKDGIDFGAPDDKPVHFFFLVCSQNIELHLHLMGCMARLLRSQKFVSELPNCKNNADVIKLVMEQERAEFLAPENA